MSESSFKMIWTKSKWTRADLDDKTVEFRIPLKDRIVHGVGLFLVSQNPQGLLFVQIRVEVQGRNWAEHILTDYQLPQLAVDRIERHPNQKIAEFRLT